ncbi:hypothetical protein GDO86_017176 [Hymenochirus boettgeri]|uniref:Uncharacterized protein n=1 Tax=Hymenochirus boettgeri TaxID=247094 RepID=A0A8T2IP68_9PIPI|nr:hypothetical protein GDO86_017176 [Hymenochirus boettgeri]
MEPASEILELSSSHDRPIVQAYNSAMSKITYSSSPTTNAYSDDIGAVGGANFEEESSTVHLDEDNENPPMILQTE